MDVGSTPTAAECANRSAPGCCGTEAGEGQGDLRGHRPGNIAVLVMERVDVDSSDSLTAVLAQVTVSALNPLRVLR